MDYKDRYVLLVIDLTAVGVTKMTEEMVSPQMAKQLVVVKKSGIAVLLIVAEKIRKYRWLTLFV